MAMSSNISFAFGHFKTTKIAKQHNNSNRILHLRFTTLNFGGSCCISGHHSCLLSRALRSTKLSTAQDRIMGTCAIDLRLHHTRTLEYRLLAIQSLVCRDALLRAPQMLCTYFWQLIRDQISALNFAQGKHTATAHM
jgi:hypothetical protein